MLKSTVVPEFPLLLSAGQGRIRSNVGSRYTFGRFPLLQHAWKDTLAPFQQNSFFSLFPSARLEYESQGQRSRRFAAYSRKSALRVFNSGFVLLFWWIANRSRVFFFCCCCKLRFSVITTASSKFLWTSCLHKPWSSFKAFDLSELPNVKRFHLSFISRALL